MLRQDIEKFNKKIFSAAISAQNRAPQNTNMLNIITF